MDWVESYEDLIKAMQEDTSDYFETRHYNKVKTIYDYYINRNPRFSFGLD